MIPFFCVDKATQEEPVHLIAFMPCSSSVKMNCVVGGMEDRSVVTSLKICCHFT